MKLLNTTSQFLDFVINKLKIIKIIAKNIQ